MINVGIVGASGYSGEVLVELLLQHPAVRLAAVTSRQQVGRALAAALPRLRSLAGNLEFSASDPAALAGRAEIDLWFLALPHGAAAEYAVALAGAGRRVIDLSADFRLGSAELYAAYYDHSHPAPGLLGRAVYALPELWPTAEAAARAWADAAILAAPGCYPTSMLVPLVPLVRGRLIDDQPGRIVVNAFSGVSGAGRKAEEMYLFVERAESAKAYGLVRHRHLAEVEEQLGRAAGRPVVIQFNPHLAPMRRGIATTITVPAAPGVDAAAVRTAWAAAYAGRPFVQILPPGQTPDTAHTTGTNRVDLAVAHDPRTGNLILTAAEDNLVKGAAGQAIQAMNVWLGRPEQEGLPR